MEPRLAGQPLGLKGLDLFAVAQGQADVVQAVKKAVFAEGLDLKRQLAAIGLDDDLALQINRQRVAGKAQHLGKQLRHLCLRQHDGQQAVLEAVVEKDVGITGRDDRPEAVLVKRPRCVLARGAAAEVFARQQHRCAGVARVIEYKVWVGFAA